MGVLSGLQPEKVFYYFEEISKIPRGSGNEEAAALYCVNFANSRGLWSYKDSLHNVLIKKDGSKGMEDKAAVILQGHLDIVCEKNKDVSHDFESDGIKIVLEGDSIKALGTTLGADNGIGVAIMLAILDDDSICHPPIECLFTAQEEIGLVGALAFDYSKLWGKIFVNLDSEQYGKVMVSCAGGVRSKVTLDYEPVKTRLSHPETYGIRVRGLKGGHSGGDIHLGRGNANKLLGRTLDFLRGKIDFELAFLSGGAKDNAIPREADAVINVIKGDGEKLDSYLQSFEKIIGDEFNGIEEGIRIYCEKEANSLMVMDRCISDKVIAVIMAIPDGVISMSREIHGLVETSNNLGVLETADNTVVFTSLIRSSVEAKKQFVESAIRNIALLAEAKCCEGSRYPGWRYKGDSVARNKIAAAYKLITGGEIREEAIHAGLECGVFADNIEGADIISIGPDMWDAHTPCERVSAASVKSIYELLLKFFELE